MGTSIMKSTLQSALQCFSTIQPRDMHHERNAAAKGGGNPISKLRRFSVRKKHSLKENCPLVSHRQGIKEHVKFEKAQHDREIRSKLSFLGRKEQESLPDSPSTHATYVAHRQETRRTRPRRGRDRREKGGAETTSCWGLWPHLHWISKRRSAKALRKVHPARVGDCHGHHKKKKKLA